MTYAAWEKDVPVTLKGDSLWQMKAYRLALFVSDIGWQDVTKLYADKRTLAVADQLYRALGSLGANLAEGYSKSTGKDRARFFEYSLGSARESREWYYRSCHVLGEAVMLHRLNFLTQIIKLLTTTIPDQRTRSLRESQALYQLASTSTDLPSLEDLLINIPLSD